MPAFFQSLKNSKLNFLIKAVVVAMLAWVIERQVAGRDHADELWHVFVQNITGKDIWWLSLAILLMPFNWALETQKWRQLTREFEPTSFWKAYRAIFAGVLFSVFTPNRVGEYGGRILWVSRENQWKAVIATMVGSFSQLLVIITLGLAGLLFFAYRFVVTDFFVLQIVGFLGVVLILLLLFIFYNIDLCVPLAKRIPGIRYAKPLLKHLVILTHYSSSELSQAIFIALIRYLLYTAQYFCMLQFFDIETSFSASLACIATIFLLQTSVPLPPVMGMFARGEVALYVWGFFSRDEMSILASSFGLWIINVIVPAFIGLIFVVSTNLLKPFGYEK